MKALAISLATPLLLFQGQSDETRTPQTLAEARAGLATELRIQVRDEEPLPVPPPELFSIVEYPGPLGPMRGYLSRIPEGEERLPAVVWLTGGFPPTRSGSYLWEPIWVGNDQSARAFRESGIPTFFPATRGVLGNPGHQEFLFGEVDDVLAAIDWLANHERIDPQRIFLGGHSTGATLALLVAAGQPAVRGIFALAPAAEAVRYGSDVLPFDPEDQREARARAPWRFMHTIAAPTFLLAGAHESRALCAATLAFASKNPLVRMHVLGAGDHVDFLSAFFQVAAQAIHQLAPEATFELPIPAVEQAFERQRTRLRHANDLENLARLWRSRVPSGEPEPVRFYFWSWEREDMITGLERAEKARLEVSEPWSVEEEDGDMFWIGAVTIPVDLSDVRALLRSSDRAARAMLDEDRTVHYNGWGL